MQIDVDSLLKAYERSVSGGTATRDTSHHNGGGTLAWRIAQQMKGCTPAQIDSAIQANLPQRELPLNARPDTLSLPGLPAKTYDMPSLNLDSAHTFGLFGDSLLPSPEARARTYGLSSEPMPYQLWRDNCVIGTLLVSFILVIYIINHARRQFVLQAKNFRYTPQNAETPFVKDIAFSAPTVVLMTLLLSIMGGFLAYIYSQHTLDLFMSRIPPYMLLLVFVGCFLVYFIAKRMVTSFVNWVFFEKHQHKLWNDACSFVLSIECLLFFPIVLVSICSDIPIEQIFIALCAVVILAKLLLAYKCFSIFFPKFYCLLHFFVYLCALEIVPLIALWQSLVYLTGNLIIKY